ncbi:CAF17-like 4Fe-4S cluster assembly/insertion protein YgfZ [Endothiovibrio diazotrophicus]
MNGDWRTFLSDAGACFEETRLLHFGDPDGERAAATGAVISPLTHRGVIEASGADTRDFLQNMTTNDLRQLSESRAQLSALLSPKGRMLALYRLFMRGENFFLGIPGATLEATLKRLRMFVLRSAVTLEDASERLVTLGIAGEDAAERLIPLFDTLPALADDVCHQGGLTLIRLSGLRPRYELYGEPAAMIEAWGRLREEGFTPVGAGPWGWLEIEAGVPSVEADTVEAFVPQMVNLQAVNGVSFTKGCYPGQEVVARSEYLGKMKRRMYRARADGDVLPAVGEELAAAGETVGANAGKVVAAQFHPEGGIELLAVIPSDEVERDAVHLGSVEGPKLRFLDLPYELPAKQ